jgi:hypothetical protein
MSIQSTHLSSYGFTRTVKRRDISTPLSTLQGNAQIVPHSHFLSTFGFPITIVSFKEEIGLYFDAEGTMEAFIGISEICEMELNPDGSESETIKQPYSIRATWRSTLAQRVLDDIITGHPLYKQIKRFLITYDDFKITFRNPDGTDGMYGRPNTFRRKMETIIKTNTLFRVAIELQTHDVASLGICSHDSFSPGRRFSYPSPAPVSGHPVPVPALNPPLAAPNKLTIEAVLDQKKSTPRPSQRSPGLRTYNGGTMSCTPVVDCGASTPPHGMP